MADTKRVNYFRHQFLLEKEFDDEQAYHIARRRDHNRHLHHWGVASGLNVTQIGVNELSVAAGLAIDRDGREISLNDTRPYALTTVGINIDVYLTISYAEIYDATDYYKQGGVENYTRTTERPVLRDSASAPASDGSEILLAKIRLGATGAIATVDETVRTLATAGLAPQAVLTAHIADGSVTAEKLAPNAVDALRITDGSIGTAELADFAVTESKIAVDAVTSSKIKDGNVGTAELANLAVTTEKINAGAVTTGKLDAGAVTIAKLADEAKPYTIENVSNAGGNINIVPSGAITVSGDNVAKQIKIGESHSTLTTNPHETTAAQIDSQGGANRIVAQINNGTGIINAARIDSSIARASTMAEKANGIIVQGTLFLNSAGTLYGDSITITQQNLLNCMVKVRGWASTLTANMYAGASGVWSPLPTGPSFEGWAITNSDKVFDIYSVTEDFFFYFPTTTVMTQLEITSTGTRVKFLQTAVDMMLWEPNGKLYYALEVSWQQ